MLDVRLMMSEKDRSRCARHTSSIINHTSHIRTGISLIEILISMFVLLFGLMGVAAIFPVGNHYVVEGEKYDLGSGLAQNAFEELQARGMLRPEVWFYGSEELAADAVAGGPVFIQQAGDPAPGSFNVPMPAIGVSDPGPGHAFVLDPLGAASAITIGSGEVHFPFSSHSLNPNNPWFNPPAPQLALAGDLWPVRRMTLPIPGALPLTRIAMTTSVAETIFRLRDDLAVAQPDQDDRPSVQTWDIDNNGNLLRRQYKGDYSWLATIVPTTSDSLESLQPANTRYGDYPCEVSVAVFRKRDTTPSEDSERLIEAQLLVGGELVMYAVGTSTTERQFVDDAVDGIRSGQWICLMGVNQTTGAFIMKWYRLLSLDNESAPDRISLDGSTTLEDVYLRRAMVLGSDWPSNSVYNLRVAILPDVISVATKEMQMEE